MDLLAGEEELATADTEWCLAGHAEKVYKGKETKGGSWVEDRAAYVLKTRQLEREQQGVAVCW